MIDVIASVREEKNGAGNPHVILHVHTAQRNATGNEGVYAQKLLDRIGKSLEELAETETATIFAPEPGKDTLPESFCKPIRAAHERARAEPEYDTDTIKLDAEMGFLAGAIVCAMRSIDELKTGVDHGSAIDSQRYIQRALKILDSDDVAKRFPKDTPEYGPRALQVVSVLETALRMLKAEIENNA